MDSTAEPVVVGFSGMPVRGGCGIRPPILRDRSTKRVTDSSRSPSWLSPEEYEDCVDRGLCTKLPREWPVTAQGVVLYADQDFVQPPDESPCVITVGETTVAVVAGRLLYVRYLSRTDALSEIARWARSLTETATKQLELAMRERRHRVRNEHLVRVEKTVLRARYCLAEGTNDSLRRRATISLAVARQLRGEEDEPVFADARIDFSDAAIAGMRTDALRERSRLVGSADARQSHRYRDRRVGQGRGQPPRECRE